MVESFFVIYETLENASLASVEYSKGTKNELDHSFF